MSLSDLEARREARRRAREERESVLLGNSATLSTITTDHTEPEEDIVERIARRRRERQERLAKLSADTSSLDYDIEKRRQERRAARENRMRGEVQQTDDGFDQVASSLSSWRSRRRRTFDEDSSTRSSSFRGASNNSVINLDNSDNTGSEIKDTANDITKRSSFTEDKSEEDTKDESEQKEDEDESRKDAEEEKEEEEDTEKKEVDTFRRKRISREMEEEKPQEEMKKEKVEVEEDEKEDEETNAKDFNDQTKEDANGVSDGEEEEEEAEKVFKQRASDLIEEEKKIREEEELIREEEQFRKEENERWQKMEEKRQEEEKLDAEFEEDERRRGEEHDDGDEDSEKKNQRQSSIVQQEMKNIVEEKRQRLMKQMNGSMEGGATPTKTDGTDTPPSENKRRQKALEWEQRLKRTPSQSDPNDRIKQIEEQRAAERKELQRAREARWREREEKLRQEAEARKKREEDLAERRRKAAEERRALQKQIENTRSEQQIKSQADAVENGDNSTDLEKGKRKGLGGLSPEKKKLLKSLIMEKAMDDLKREQDAEALEKQRVLEERVPPLEIESMDEARLEKVVRDLYKRVVALEEEKYDWEVKLRKQDQEMNELNIKVNDIKGKFVKPVLKKVSKTEQKMSKFDKEKLKRKMGGFREQLKSTGHSKFALDDKEEVKKPDWGQTHLKHGKDEEGGEEEGEEGEEEEEEEEEEE